MERTEKLTPFEMFILAGSGNPANDLTVHSFPLWACELILAAPAANYGGYLPEGALCRWAAVEALNYGSFQRTAFPMPLPDSWLGSGRWLAGDNGGWLRHVRDRVNQWSDLADDQRRPWFRLSRLGLITVQDVLDRRERAWKLRRGQLIEFIVGSHRYEADLADNLVRQVGLSGLAWTIYPAGPADDTAEAWDAQPFARFPDTPEELEAFSRDGGWEGLHRSGVYLAIETKDLPAEEVKEGENWLVTTGRVSFFRDTPPSATAADE